MQLPELRNTAPVRSGVAALGNNTKSSPPPKCLQATEGGASSPEKGEKNNRALRYEMQAEARRLHLAGHDPENPENRIQLNKLHRVTKCRLVPVAEMIGVHRSKEHQKAFYSGLAICGSVWDCPVCAAKIQERRREEIAQAMTKHYDNSGTVTMLTLTFPHYAFQSCKELLERQAEALKYFRKGKQYDNYKKRIGYIGLIRGLEVTKGQNGWHPHTHELWFHTPGNHGFLAFIKKRWAAACSKAGLIPKGKLTDFRKYAVDVKHGATCSDYLAKTDDSQRYFGADSEIAKSGIKQSRGGKTPFALLAESCTDDGFQSGRDFLEYSKAFKGKRQLYWTNGLKKLFGIGELTDDEIAQKEEDKADILAKLSRYQWRIVRQAGARAQLLELAETPAATMLQIKSFITSLASGRISSGLLRPIPH
jgi:hypothetical protein